MRYTTTALVAAALLATTGAYAQQAASPAPQATPGSDTSAQTPSAQTPSAQTQGKPGAANAASDQDQLSRRLVRHIQTRLKQQGYFGRAPDGMWDNDTVTALQDFQDSSGLQSTGQLDGATIYILGIATPPYSGSSAPPQSGSSTPPQSGSSTMQAPAVGGAMAQAAADQTQQQPSRGGGDIRQVMDAYQAGYQQGLMQGFRQAQALLTSQGGPGQGSSQPPSGQQTPSR
ncbi:MAG: Peptidoglycan-binding protein [Rhodospirillales bacterium]|nr:Peptidoglycan-binding protein [Rhodospirillales bacterium]